MRNNRKNCLLFILCPVILLFFTACAGRGPDLKKQETVESMSAYAMQTQAKVRERLAENPESVVEESLSALNEVLNYADEVRADPDRFNLSKIQEYMRRISIINENMERFRDMTLKTDISFPVGTYKLSDLSPDGRLQCGKLAQKIIETVAGLRKRYPEYSIRITLKTVGYTDEIPIVSGPLENTIRANLEEPEETGKDGRRKQYNRVLSRLRAGGISRYIMENLRKEMPAGADIQYVEKIVGNGENFPHKKPDSPYAARDERRRICIISPYIEIIL